MTPLSFTAPITLKASGKARRFSILAYSGGLLRVDGFAAPVVVDLSGLAANAVSVILDHVATTENTIGQVESIDNNGRSLVLAGTVTGQSTRVREVLAQADAGHQWQASIGAMVEQSEDIPAGQSVTVNGQRFTGPIIVARRSVLRETSVLPVGADPTTQVNLAARAATLKETTMTTAAPSASMTFDEWLTEHGIDPKTMTPELTALVMPIFDAEQNGTQPPSPAAAAAIIDLRAAANIDRIAAINRIASGFPLIQAAAVRNGWSPIETENHVLKASSRMHTPAYRAGGTDISTSDHITASLMVRAGYSNAAEKQFGANVMAQSQSLHGASLVDMCRASLVADGRDIPGDRASMIRAALSTGSMPVALGPSADKILTIAYLQAPSAWQKFAAVKSSPNFRTQTAVRPNWGGDLTPLGPGGEIKHGTFAEELYTWQIATFAKMFMIDRTMIINDDLSAFDDVVPGMGRAAARSLSALVATTLLANTGSFFGTGHNNFISGATSNLSSVSLAQAIMKLRQMRDADGNLLDLAPKVLLVPPELEQTALALIRSAEVARQTATDGQLPTGNTFLDIAEVVVEPRLSDAAFTGNSSTAWYLFSDPRNASIVVAFLDGKASPTLESFGLDHDVNTLAYSFRCFFDYGSSLGDFRTGIKSAGV